MKIGVRIAVFLLGAGLVFVGWYKTHGEMISLQSPGSPNPAGSSEVLVVIGGFVLLMAFAPSAKTLGRWMSLKRPKKPLPAHFKRRGTRS